MLVCRVQECGFGMNAGYARVGSGSRSISASRWFNIHSYRSGVTVRCSGMFGRNSGETCDIAMLGSPGYSYFRTCEQCALLAAVNDNQFVPHACLFA